MQTPSWTASGRNCPKPLNELATVTDGELTFTASMVQDGNEYPVQSVTLNGRTLTGIGDTYTA